MVVNNMKYDGKYYVSNLTYRKRNDWISEIDVCIAAHKILHYIQNFTVDQDLTLPSDHATISIVLFTPVVDMLSLDVRSRSLGDHATLYSNCKQKFQLNRNIKFCNIDKASCSDKLFQVNIPQVDVDTDTTVSRMTDILHSCAKASRYSPVTPPADAIVSRWERLLNAADDRRMWQAIDWRGNYKDNNMDDNNVCPTDEDSKEFYEEVYNPHGVECLEPADFQTNVTIPVLDDDITVNEVFYEIQKLKQDKACGLDGISSGIFKILTAQWIHFVLSVFNAVFSSGSYPLLWQSARMSMIFKKR